MVTQIRDQPLTGAASRLRSRRELGDPLSKHEIGGPAFDAGLRRSSIATHKASNGTQCKIDLILPGPQAPKI